MNNARILILGFSCTEVNNGYAPKLIPELERTFPEAEIFRAGLGGLSPPVVPAFLRNLHKAKGPFTHVILEISTSVYAWHKKADEESCRDILNDLLTLCSEIKAVPLFLMLHRRNPNPNTVNLNGIIREVCTAAKIEFIDLAEGLIEKYGEEFVNNTLRDDVHTNDIGGFLQFDLMLWRVIHWIKFSSNPNKTPHPKLRRVPISFLDLVPEATNFGSFVRRDYEQNYLEYLGKDALEIRFEKPKTILGFSFLLGPHGGYLQLGLDESPNKTIRTFDERCYYTRVGFKFFNGFSGRTVESLQFEPDSGHEHIKLLKGQRNAGPVRHRFLDLVELLPVEADLALCA